MKPLANDITRCYGYLCINKQQCRRFTTLLIDPPTVLSYVHTMVGELAGAAGLVAEWAEAI